MRQTTGLKKKPTGGTVGEAWGGTTRMATRTSTPHFTPNQVENQGPGIPIFRADGRVVGTVKDGVFRKMAWATRHMLRRPMAWAVDEAALREAERLGAWRVEILDRDTGQVYSASIESIRRLGFQFDRGHGQQIGLALHYWQVNNKDALQLPLWQEMAE